MKQETTREARSDVLVVGGGAAGLATALACRGLSVRLLAKGRAGADGSTAMAQGGIAAALGSNDDSGLHARDTLAAGGGGTDAAMAALLAGGAPRAIETLLAAGARLDRDAVGALALGREAAHSRDRIVHAQGDATGAEVGRALGQAVRGVGHVVVEDQVTAHRLLRRGRRVVGVEATRWSGEPVRFLSAAVVLATGGIGQAFADTTNPQESRGQGLAMAALAGATLADLEFVQFHPTALAVASDPLPLLTEALRGAGALLVDDRGRRFMDDVDPRAELAPRDIVARAIARFVGQGRGVFLDARALGRDALARRFPTVFEICRRHGLDPAIDLLPVRPAAHYHMGGVLTDGRGRTSLAGLWAVGEAACTGVHGSNRLASNSLLECLVFGRRVAEDILARKNTARSVLPLEGASPGHSEVRDLALESEVRRLMSQHLGVIRCQAGLATARRELAAMSGQVARGPGATAALWTVATLVSAAALARPGSSGSHFRADDEPEPTEPLRLEMSLPSADPLRPVLHLRPAGAALDAVASR